MKKINILFFLIFFSVNSFAGYEIEFFIGESKNTRPLKHHLKIKEIDIKNENTKSLMPTFDEFGEPLAAVYNKVGDEIAPGKNFHFKFDNNSNLLQGDLLNMKPSEIVFTVLDKNKKELGDIKLSWLYNENKINFISDENSCFVFLPFQRNMPTKDKKTGLLQYTYEISLIDLRKE